MASNKRNSDSYLPPKSVTYKALPLIPWLEDKLDSKRVEEALDNLSGLAEHPLTFVPGSAMLVRGDLVRKALEGCAHPPEDLIKRIAKAAYFVVGVDPLEEVG